MYLIIYINKFVYFMYTNSVIYIISKKRVICKTNFFANQYTEIGKVNEYIIASIIPLKLIKVLL